MHFHDSFIAHFFPDLSLSCCHKQTSAVPLLFIIHKSNKVASQDGARRHFRDVRRRSFLLLRPLSISISSFVSWWIRSYGVPQLSRTYRHCGCDKKQKEAAAVFVGRAR